MNIRRYVIVFALLAGFSTVWAQGTPGAPRPAQFKQRWVYAKANLITIP